MLLPRSPKATTSTIISAPRAGRAHRRGGSRRCRRRGRNRSASGHGRRGRKIPGHAAGRVARPLPARGVTAPARLPPRRAPLRTDPGRVESAAHAEPPARPPPRAAPRAPLGSTGRSSPRAGPSRSASACSTRSTRPARSTRLPTRLALGLTAGVLVGMTFVSEWVRRNALGLVYGFFLAVSAWQVWLAHASALSPATAFGLILVFIGCSAGFQTGRALVTYSVAFVGATAAVAQTIPAPGVPTNLFLATLATIAVLGALLFRIRQTALPDARRRPRGCPRRRPRQVRVSRRDEPRDPDAAQRRHRHDGRARDDAARGRSARGTRHHPRLGRRALGRHHGHPGLLEDRGRPRRVGGAPVRPARARRGHGRRRRAGRVRRGVETVGHVCPGVPGSSWATRRGCARSCSTCSPTRSSSRRPARSS